MPIYWRQYKNQSVKDYIRFIAKESYQDQRYGLKPSKYMDQPPPERKTMWLFEGIRDEIYQELGVAFKREPASSNFDEMSKAVQRAEWLWSLKQKKYGSRSGDMVSSWNSEYFKVDRDGYIIVYTDGACPRNGQQGAKAGIGVWFSEDHHRNCSQPLDRSYRQTNNVAEIKAVIEAINIIKNCGFQCMAIHTDSEFIINSMTKNIYVWLKNGWLGSRGNTIVNRNEFEELLLSMEGIDVKWVHVRAHERINSRDAIGNHEADRLARKGARQIYQ